MQVDFTPEQEARLAQIASKEGIKAEELVKDVALRLRRTLASALQCAKVSHRPTGETSLTKRKWTPA
jgi:hypothetical protein